MKKSNIFIIILAMILSFSMLFVSNYLNYKKDDDIILQLELCEIDGDSNNEIIGLSENFLLFYNNNSLSYKKPIPIDITLLKNNYIFLVDNIINKSYSNFVFSDKKSCLILMNYLGEIIWKKQINNIIEKINIENIEDKNESKIIVIKYINDEVEIYDCNGYILLNENCNNIDFINVVGDPTKEIIINGGGTIIDINMKIIENIDVIRYKDINYDYEKDLLINESYKISVIFSNSNKILTNVNIDEVDKILFISNTGNNNYYYIQSNSSNQINTYYSNNSYNHLLWGNNVNDIDSIIHIGINNMIIYVIINQNDLIYYIIDGIFFPSNMPEEIGSKKITINNIFFTNNSIYILYDGKGYPIINIKNNINNQFYYMELNLNSNISYYIFKHFIIIFSEESNKIYLSIFDIYNDEYQCEKIYLTKHFNISNICVLICDIDGDNNIDIFLGINTLIHYEITII